MVLASFTDRRFTPTMRFCLVCFPATFHLLASPGPAFPVRPMFTTLGKSFGKGFAKTLACFFKRRRYARRVAQHIDSENHHRVIDLTGDIESIAAQVRNRTIINHPVFGFADRLKTNRAIHLFLYLNSMLIDSSPGDADFLRRAFLTEPSLRVNLRLCLEGDRREFYGSALRTAICQRLNHMD